MVVDMATVKCLARKAMNLPHLSIPKRKDESKSPRKLTLRQITNTAMKPPVLDLPLLDPPPVLSFKSTRP